MQTWLPQSRWVVQGSPIVAPQAQSRAAATANEINACLLMAGARNISPHLAKPASSSSNKAATMASTGGSFLINEVGSERIMAPEHFTEEQRLYYKTAAQFSREQVRPKAEEIE